jgi:hypothetical protein
MSETNALQWELHAQGSSISFVASREERHYHLIMRRNETVVLADIAKDTATLLHKSARLRSHLQELGYSASAIPARQSQPGGGVCWGPGSGMEPSLLSVMV